MRNNTKHESFHPSIWAAEPSDKPRTANNPDSFHSHDNSQFYTPYRPYSNIFQVIDVLKDFQFQTMLKILSISINKFNAKQRNDTLKNSTYYTHDG